ncbi:hypothetical protein J3458_009138 [Metarhizium acridum]|uniref:uncharacterized protein n=1 Tax=Metarhizium acridum TaxID=92637 RepID=UPI001C6BCAAA|nr:hypothetical protein J3458_009138 [Metarhizium acridum]
MGPMRNGRNARFVPSVESIDLVALLSCRLADDRQRLLFPSFHITDFVLGGKVLLAQRRDVYRRAVHLFCACLGLEGQIPRTRQDISPNRIRIRVFCSVGSSRVRWM